MVELKELRISFDSKYLDISVNVPDGPAFANVKIEKIAFVTQDNYTVGYPQNKSKIELELTKDFPIQEYAITNDKIYTNRIPGKLLPGLCDNMFFVYVQTTGEPDESVPCPCNKSLNTFPVANLASLYKIRLTYLNAYLTDCKKYKEKLVDLMLKENIYFEALSFLNYPLAIDIYKNIIRKEIEKCGPIYMPREYVGAQYKSCNC